MTSKITDRPLRKTGRPPKRPPADAAERIRALSAEGHSTVGIAQQLGVGRKTLDKWRAQFPELDEAYREGVERERYELHSGLVQKAKAGNIVAAMFLLKARHGYREGDQGGQDNRVQIQIALPAAMSLEQFAAIAQKPAAGGTPAIEKEETNA